ncbi:MAG: hypoxanthine phosphoribosyltransferase, partial [Lachnospiraceae bacterium]|nr:hypoxanthine phosphoribosyltransferase [Lachnospiraceae bacterium]
MIDESRIRVMIDRITLEERIDAVGRQISSDYKGKELVMVCVLKGGAMFMTQLCKSIDVRMTQEFMVVSSYGNARISSGEVRVKKDLDDDITGRDVLIVEDIVDTGRTLLFLTDYLLQKGAASVRVCTMLDKPARRVVPMKADYSCFEIEDEFVLGYGLDYDQ